VEGTEGAPVVFSSPAGWEGIEFRDSAGSRISHARFFGARTALNAASSSLLLRGCVFRECEIALKLVRLSNPTVEDCVFQNNGIAVDQETRSTSVLRRNVFQKQRQTAVLVTHNCGGLIEGNRFEGNPKGIVLLRQYAGEISGNVFRENGIAVFCEQTRTSPILRGNRFEKNREGVSSVSFSSPRLEGNVFIGNQTALRNDQLGSPTVRHNLFRENGTAVTSLRRSAPRVEKNVLEGNRVALFCDYSSYPGVSANNFVGNGRGVELGGNQSADFEKRFGSRAVIERKSAAKRGKGPGGPPPSSVPAGEFIDVRGNWWGKDTSRLAAAGPNGNVEIFFDRSDRPTVTMEGYGEERFHLDQVRFHPWLERRVQDAGPPQENRKIHRPERRG
jgi:nitrous oxidase accessory protein NosD